MADLDVLLRFPNIGQPSLVRTSSLSQAVTFPVLFAGYPDLDLKNTLQGNLYLQRLADTRQVLQDKIYAESWTYKNTTEWGKLWDIKQWPAQVQKALIPLEVVKVEAPVASAWTGVPIFWDPVGYPFSGAALKDRDFTPKHYIDFSHAYWVTLRISAQDLQGLEVPQLFNFIQWMPSEKAYHLNFHAVYLHDRDWQDFSFIHATDTHLAWRNDFISSEILKATGKKPADFVNFNDNFRDFIQHANEMHQQGSLDFVLITGDLVDYVEIKRPFVNIWENYKYPWENYTLLRDLVVAWKMTAGEVVDQELEVPLFTLLGNHDYRPSEYPLIATYELAGGVDLYTSEQYGAFFLNRDEALAYESGSSKDMPYYSEYDGLADQSHYDKAPWRYKAIINPDLDFVIPLGRHRIICLDSGPDKGEFTGLMDAIGWYDSAIPEGSRYDLVHTTPDSEGFSAGQIQFLEDEMEAVEGLAIVACHSAIINYRRNPPPHQFRETEHIKLSQDALLELKDILYHDEFEGWDFEILKAIAMNPNLVSEEAANYSFEDWVNDNGWCFGKTSYFKKGQRDSDLGRGVPDERFKEFFSALMKKVKKKTSAVLVLSGHTHHSIEYHASWMDDKIAFWHDYYLDGTLEGQSPGQYWEKTLPEYSTPLNRSTDPKKWWQDHSPLFVQTLSVTAPPGASKETGVRCILVQDDTITQIERGELPLQQSTSSSNQPYFILATSPP